MSHIPRQYNFPAPRGEYQTECAYCGITWYRSDLRRDESGLLACPDDQEGRCTAELDRLNAEAAAQAIAELPAGIKEPW